MDSELALNNNGSGSRPASVDLDTEGPASERGGAHVVELAPYVWERPIDPAPVVALLDGLDAAQVDALLITSQAQVENACPATS